MSIFHVLSNLKHNGQVFEKGTLFAGEENQHQDLVKIGVLAVIDGAETVEEAKEIIGVNAEQAKAPEAEAPKTTPQDTWGAQPDTVPEAPKEPVAPISPESGSNEQVEAPTGQKEADVDAPKTTENAGDNL